MLKYQFLFDKLKAKKCVTQIESNTCVMSHNITFHSNLHRDFATKKCNNTLRFFFSRNRQTCRKVTCNVTFFKIQIIWKGKKKPTTSPFFSTQDGKKWKLKRKENQLMNYSQWPRGWHYYNKAQDHLISASPGWIPIPYLST